MAAESLEIAAVPRRPEAPSSRLRSLLTRFGAGDAQVGGWLAAILIFTALVYCRSLGNEFVGDLRFTVQSKFIGDWLYLWKSLFHDEGWLIDPVHPSQNSFYRPMSGIWVALNFHLFGLHPAGWLAAKIALHLLCVWLVFRIAWLLGADRPTGLLAAALFALMPVNAEAVVYAVASPISAAFQLAAFESYLRYQGESVAKDRPRHSLAVSLAFYAAALLTYEGAITFPLLIAAHAFLLGSDWDDTSVAGFKNGLRRTFSAVWPYAIEVAGGLALRSFVLGYLSRGSPLRIDSGTPIWFGIVTSRFPGLVAGSLILLIMPWLPSPVNFIWPIPPNAIQTFMLLKAGLAAASAAAIIVIYYFLIKYHSRYCLWLFCAAWIPIPLMMVAICCHLETHYIYLPAAGFCVLAASVAVDFARGSAVKATVVKIAAVAVLAAYAGILFSLQRYWKNNATFYSRYIEESPLQSDLHYRRGLALEDHGDITGARREFDTAAALPNADPALYRELARLEVQLGDHAAAERAMAQWVKRLDHPDASAYIDLAIADDAAGDAHSAQAALAKAAALPGSAEITALADAQIRFRHGDSKRPEEILRELLRRHPDNQQAQLDLGMVLFAQHRYDEALAIYRRAASGLSTSPGIHYRIAMTLHQMGREREAHDECAIALAQAPGDPKAKALMAAIDRGGGVH
ncbi:MAG TPA: tetratricopeptide repeat protein [Candidatus Binataceae bacterium]|nr:tetratricopeptide repeat protein [Candidatus Binataceae bacterium]